MPPARPLRLDENRNAASTPRENDDVASRLAQVLEGLDHLEAGLVLYGADDRVLFCNRRFREVYPAVADLLVPGTDYADIARAHHRRCLKASYPLGEDDYVRSRVEQHAHPDEGDYEYRDESGKWLLVSDRRTADGCVIGLRVDITGRKLAEQALRASEERHQLALAAGRLVAWEWSVGDARIGWGERNEQIRGPLPPGVADYPDFRDMVHPGDRERYLATGRRAFEEIGPYHCEFRVVWLDASVHTIKSQGVVRRGTPGERDRIFGISQDITDRVAAGEALRESEARYRTLLETTTDAVLMVDDTDTIRYANAAVEALFGWMPAELVGGGLAVLQPERLREAHRDGVRRAFSTGERRQNWRAVEATGLHRDGREFPIELSFSLTQLGGRRYLVGFVRDIEIRKRAERELQELNATLESRVQERTAELSAVNRELESFSYTVAHDLRAPLRAIDGFSQVLEDELASRLAPEERGFLKRIRANTTVMAQMIDELLDFSRIGRTELSLRPVDLDGLARLVAGEISPDYANATVAFADLPVVDADPTLMRLVFVNLMDNALKFSARVAEPRVRVEATTAPGQIVVSITDNGVGFDPQYASKLFGVFQRLHSREEFEGTGIGLATVARIVTRHGGRIWADSRPGEGASFHFTVPVRGGEGGPRAEAAVKAGP